MARWTCNWCSPLSHDNRHSRLTCYYCGKNRGEPIPPPLGDVPNHHQAAYAPTAATNSMVAVSRPVASAQEATDNARLPTPWSVVRGNASAVPNAIVPGNTVVESTVSVPIHIVVNGNVVETAIAAIDANRVIPSNAEATRNAVVPDNGVDDNNEDNNEDYDDDDDYEDDYDHDDDFPDVNFMRTRNRSSRSEQDEQEQQQQQEDEQAVTLCCRCHVPLPFITPMSPVYLSNLVYCDNCQSTAHESQQENEAIVLMPPPNNRTTSHTQSRSRNSLGQAGSLKRDEDYDYDDDDDDDISTVSDSFSIVSINRQHKQDPSTLESPPPKSDKTATRYFKINMENRAKSHIFYFEIGVKDINEYQTFVTLLMDTINEEKQFFFGRVMRNLTLNYIHTNYNEKYNKCIGYLYFKLNRRAPGVGKSRENSIGQLINSTDLCIKTFICCVFMNDYPTAAPGRGAIRSEYLINLESIITVTSLHNGTELRRKLNGELAFSVEWAINSSPCIQAITFLRENLYNNRQCDPKNYLEADGSGPISRRGGDVHEVFPSDHLVPKPQQHDFNSYPVRLKEVYDKDAIGWFRTCGMTVAEWNAWRITVLAEHLRYTKLLWEIYKSRFDDPTNTDYNLSHREDFEQIDHIFGHTLEMRYQAGIHGFFTNFDFGCRYELDDISNEFNERSDGSYRYWFGCEYLDPNTGDPVTLKIGSRARWEELRLEGVEPFCSMEQHDGSHASDARFMKVVLLKVVYHLQLEFAPRNHCVVASLEPNRNLPGKRSHASVITCLQEVPNTAAIDPVSGERCTTYSRPDFRRKIISLVNHFGCMMKGAKNTRLYGNNVLREGE